jgi:hypothetical protein
MVGNMTDLKISCLFNIHSPLFRITKHSHSVFFNQHLTWTVVPVVRLSLLHFCYRSRSCQSVRTLRWIKHCSNTAHKVFGRILLEIHLTKIGPLNAVLLWCIQQADLYQHSWTFKVEKPTWLRKKFAALLSKQKCRLYVADSWIYLYCYFKCPQTL